MIDPSRNFCAYSRHDQRVAIRRPLGEQGERSFGGFEDAGQGPAFAFRCNRRPGVQAASAAEVVGSNFPSGQVIIEFDDSDPGTVHDEQ